MASRGVKRRCWGRGILEYAEGIDMKAQINQFRYSSVIGIADEKVLTSSAGVSAKKFDQLCTGATSALPPFSLYKNASPVI